MKNIKIGFGGWLTIAVVVLVGLLIWQSSVAKQKKVERQAEQTSREVALTCTTDMATVYHIHPELTILFNGVVQTLPNNIGIQPNCMTSIHTHSSDGVFHVEAPIAKDFTLSDFFAVWKKDFSEKRILEQDVVAPATLTVTVNGEIVTSYENTLLRDKDTIIISYKSI